MPECRGTGLSLEFRRPCDHEKRPNRRQLCPVCGEKVKLRFMIFVGVLYDFKTWRGVVPAHEREE